MKKTEKIDIWNWIIFLIPWIMYAFVTLILFHRQSVFYAGGYPSDMYPYIQHMQNIETQYEFPYPIMFWMGKLYNLILNPQMAMAFAVTTLNALTPPILKWYVDKYIKKIGKWNVGIAIFSTALTFSMLFVSMLFLNLDIESIGWRYRGVFTPNPFHNATYLATRPFTIVCFFALAEILQSYEEKVDKKNYIILAVAMFLTTMTKPSFIYGFIIMTGIILLYRMCRKKFKNYKQTLILASCAIPTFIVLLYQFRGLFMGLNSRGEETGIGIGFLDAWEMLEKPIGEAIILGLAFPILVLVFNLIYLKSEHDYRLSVQMLITNLILLMFLYEKGFRIHHVNFAWGYMHGMFFAYIMSVLLLLKNTIQKRQPKVILIMQWGLYLWHLVCGIVYFVGVMQGNTFL